MKEAREVAGMDFARPSEFPRIALYVEQVTSYFEDIMRHVRLRAGEKLLTKTMINNYAKEGILHRPQNKKYDKTHIIKLVYIYLLKRVLTMGDIKCMFEMLEHENSLEPMYDCLLDEMEHSREEYEEHIRQSIERCDARLKQRGIQSPENLMLLTMMRISVEAAASQAIVARLVDGSPAKKKEE